jgi:hypothetical protein
MAGMARTQREAGEQEPRLTAVPTPAPAAVARVIALQRSAGNQAVAQLLRYKGGSQDELLELVLRGAALAANDAMAAIRAAQDEKEASKRFADIKPQLHARLDEALQLAGQSKGFKGADDLFQSAGALVALAEERKLTGGGTLAKKLEALAAALEKRGYHRPTAAAKPQAPRDIGNRGQARAATLGLGGAGGAV